MAKRSYPNVAIFTHDGQIYVINDNLYEVSAIAKMDIVNLNGTVLEK